MENKTSYSLQDAKETVARSEGYKSYAEAVKIHDHLTDSIAILWAKAATEELRKKAEFWENAHANLEEILRAQYDLEVEDTRKENERLASYCEDMGERVKKAISYSLDRDNEIERLTQSNKELVEALQTIIEVIMLNGMYNIAPVTIKDCLELIKNNKSKP